MHNYDIETQHTILKLVFCGFFLVAATFLSVLDDGMNSTSQCHRALDIVFRGALRFITNLKSLTHHCLLVGRSADYNHNSQLV